MSVSVSTRYMCVCFLLLLWLRLLRAPVESGGGRTAADRKSVRARVSGSLDDRSTATAGGGAQCVCRRSQVAVAATAAVRPTDDLRAWPAVIQMVLVCCGSTTTTAAAAELPRDDIRNILGRRRLPSCLAAAFSHPVHRRITHARVSALSPLSPPPTPSPPPRHINHQSPPPPRALLFRPSPLSEPAVRGLASFRSWILSRHHLHRRGLLQRRLNFRFSSPFAFLPDATSRHEHSSTRKLSSACLEPP